MWTGLKPKVNTLGLKMRQLVLINSTSSFSLQNEMYTTASEIGLTCGSLSPLLSSRRWSPECRESKECLVLGPAMSSPFQQPDLGHQSLK